MKKRDAPPQQRVASQRMPSRRGGPLRRPPDSERKVPSIVREVLGSSSQSLDASTRASMETHLGHDFSQVRVHTGDKAERSARSVGALAYTVGRDIVFGKGQYAPGTARGRQVLAHELTHVVQQRGNRASPSALQKLETGSSQDSLEQEADRVSKTLDTPSSTAISTPGHLRLQRLVIPLPGWGGWLPLADDDSYLTTTTIVHTSRGERFRFGDTEQRKKLTIPLGSDVTVTMTSYLYGFRDDTFDNEENRWRVDYSVRVKADDAGRTLTILPGILTKSGGEDEAPWLLNTGPIKDTESIGLQFILTSTESWGAEGGSELGGGLELGEKGSMGGAGALTLTKSVGATQIRAFGFMVDLELPKPTYTERSVSVYFGTNKSRLGRPDFSGLINLLDTFVDPNSSEMETGEDIDVYVLGYASKISDGQYNQNLSRDRANAVAQYVKDWLPDAKLHVAAYGASAVPKNLAENSDRPIDRYVLVKVKSLNKAPGAR